MQYILNAKERSYTFLRFLIFFVVTVALIVTAIYFNFRVPSEHNERLSEEIINLQNKDAEQAKFVEKMTAAVRLFDSLEKRGPHMRVLIFTLDNKIRELNEFKAADSTYEVLNRTIVNSFSELLVLKQEANDLKIKAAELRQQLEDCRSNATIVIPPVTTQ